MIGIISGLITANVFDKYYLIQWMANEPRPFSVINSYNPNAVANISAPQLPPNTPSLQQLQLENQNMRHLIDKLKLEKQNAIRQQIQEEPSGVKSQFESRVQENDGKIKQLQGIVRSQQEVIAGYKARLREFQDNLVNIMKLDKDIHTRMVNPQSSSTLEANVRNVLVALNGNAPVDRLIKMIQSIKV